MPRRPAVHEMITSRKVPKPKGPFPHGVRVTQPGRWLFVSGQIPAQTPTGVMSKDNMRMQAQLAFAHMRNVVLDAGFSMDEVVQVRIYVTDLKHFDRVDDEYCKLFKGQAFPARTVLKVAGLLNDADIEVEAHAIKRQEPEAAATAAPDKQAPQPTEGGGYGGGGSSGTSINPI